MTETKNIRLYDEQVMLRSCQTVVTACVELKNGFELELAQAELANDVKVIEVHFDDIPAEAARKLAQRLAENPQAQVTLFYKSKNRLNYILTQGSDVPGSCRERISILNKKLGGKGGGKDNMAQGSSAL